MKNQKNNQKADVGIKYTHQLLDSKQWYVELSFDNNVYGSGIANKKKEAEELAAKEAMEKLAHVDEIH